MSSQSTGTARKPKRTDQQIGRDIGGGRTLLSIAGKLADAIGEHKKVHALDTPAGASLIQQMAAIAIGTATVATTVAWSAVLAFVIACCRFVSDVHPDIIGANFPYQPGDLTTKEVVIVAIDSDMTTPEVLALLESKGLRPARLMELLLWWLTHPEQHASCLVVALGSLSSGQPPYVRGVGANRNLHLYAVARRWYRNYAFAAVSKQL